MSVGLTSEPSARNFPRLARIDLPNLSAKVAQSAGTRVCERNPMRLSQPTEKTTQRLTKNEVVLARNAGANEVLFMRDKKDRSNAEPPRFAHTSTTSVQ